MLAGKDHAMDDTYLNKQMFAWTLSMQEMTLNNCKQFFIVAQPACCPKARILGQIVSTI